ncbi:hypothetical protein HPB52_002039 [Rhipicephalus sanguineus]|uniref:Uncharacterized protein n=1 Tax=Rhipicephalus sanguineus TaxID=34632 RepID=A0A9D4SR92_RHISA|nr:hypothetical protein HPB52_002039 [Rhipicephalus sanguineus]
MQYNHGYSYNDPAANGQAYNQNGDQYGQYGEQYGQYALAPSGRPSLVESADVDQEKQAAAASASKQSLSTESKESSKSTEAGADKEVVNKEPKKPASWPLNLVMLGSVLLVLIGVTVTLMVIAGALGTRSAPEAYKEPAMVTVGSDRRSHLPEGIVIHPYRRPHDRVTNATVTHLPETDSTEQASTEEFIPEKAMSPAPLVCTMGMKTNSTQMFPTDGLCEYIFYDSLFKDGFGHFEPPDVNTSLATFVQERSKFVHTEFGIGLAFKIGILAAKDVKTAWAISVTMKGRWTSLEANESVAFLSRCAFDPSTVSFGRIAEVCKNPRYGLQYNYSKEVEAAQFQDTADRELFSFDNEVALCQKVIPEFVDGAQLPMAPYSHPAAGYRVSPPYIDEPFLKLPEKHELTAVNQYIGPTATGTSMEFCD